MTEPVAIAGLLVARPLVDLVRDEIAPGTGIEPDHVWALLGDVVREFGPRNAALLARRDDLQAQIDAWLAADPRRALDVPAMRQFLADIGYLVPEGPDFTIETRRVDAEIGEIAGPQLVVPVDNARYALNAANARWGSLYDALYGTDVLPEGPGTAKGSSYNPGRGALVIAEANRILDGIVPLAAGTWQQVTRLTVDGGNLVLALDDGRTTTLGDPDLFAGSAATDGVLTNVLLRHNRLHLDIWIDPAHPIGQQHPAGVRDVLLEAAVSTIMDCEDSVAAVDADDKARVYGNWAGIMKGTLAVAFGKAGSTLQRTLNPDRAYVDRAGQPLVLHGRSLLLVRNVGAHVLTTAVTTADGQPIAETFLDCVITTLAAIHDLRGRGRVRNSRTGSVYIVKPKHHGPDEVQLSVDLFARVERGFGLPVNTLKIGLMDEERRTTVNLKECIRVARERLVFINTGFLDRTGDEIHTHMNAGPIVPKAAIKAETWIGAYENWNVDIGLATGLPGRAQIGKGMWAQPDDMQAMLAAKQAHPDAGASCAWVPSPTAATLHALHYHRTDVRARQQELASRPRARLEDLLTPPLLTGPALSPEAIQQELDNNAQGILGYVVRWVDQGVGCSKVPDIHDVGLMEDRATLRISSQHIANWLHHGLVDRQQVVVTMQRMARIVDTQNAGDAAYQPMAPDFERSIAFQAAMDLVFEGRRQPNGYTEHVLAARRRERKARG